MADLVFMESEMHVWRRPRGLQVRHAFVASHRPGSREFVSLCGVLELNECDLWGPERNERRECLLCLEALGEHRPARGAPRRHDRERVAALIDEADELAVPRVDLVQEMMGLPRQSAQRLVRLVLEEGGPRPLVVPHRPIRAVAGAQTKWARSFTVCAQCLMQWPCGEELRVSDSALASPIVQS